MADDDVSTTFDFPLERGDAEIKGWWFDKDGNRLAGAYYLTEERTK